MGEQTSKQSLRQLKAEYPYAVFIELQSGTFCELYAVVYTLKQLALAEKNRSPGFRLLFSVYAYLPFEEMVDYFCRTDESVLASAPYKQLSKDEALHYLYLLTRASALAKQVSQVD